MFNFQQARLRRRARRAQQRKQAMIIFAVVMAACIVILGLSAVFESGDASSQGPVPPPSVPDVVSPAATPVPTIDVVVGDGVEEPEPVEDDPVAFQAKQYEYCGILNEPLLQATQAEFTAAFERCVQETQGLTIADLEQYLSEQ